VSAHVTATLTVGRKPNTVLTDKLGSGMELDLDCASKQGIPPCYARKRWLRVAANRFCGVPNDDHEAHFGRAAGWERHGCATVKGRMNAISHVTNKVDGDRSDGSKPSSLAGSTII
jgi:hypothetical protein